MTDPIQKIREFIVIVNKHVGPTHFEDTDDLIESGLIDSLQFVEFVLLISELSGRDIALDTLNIDELRSISAIRKAFFEGQILTIRASSATSAKAVAGEGV